MNGRLLADFLNHGLLPFVGRSEEIQRLVSFWHDTFNAHELRIALVVGEAGIGKSRLLEELLPRVIDAGGSVIQAKLVPGMVTSLIPLIARALNASGMNRSLLKKNTEETLPGVTAALQKLSSLRPTLLVIEDIHLLSQDALSSFATLLESLAGVPLSILCLTRPMELVSRAVMERYLVEEIEMSGFSKMEIATLWGKLFETAPEAEVITILYQATLGSPLAVRSAIRGALKSEAIAPTFTGGFWSITVSIPALISSLQRNVHLLSEGMIAHLVPEERQALKRIASLGEVFSLEAAQMLLKDAPTKIEALLFKGVLTTWRGVVTPLPGRHSFRPPLAFTHSLLHRDLIENAPEDVDGLARVIASELPLYSVLPFQMLARHCRELSLPREVVEAAFDRALQVTAVLDRGTDWELSRDTWKAAEALLNAHQKLYSPDEYREARLRLLNYRMFIDRRSLYSEDLQEAVDEMLRLTEDPVPERLMMFRVIALSNRYGIGFERDYSKYAEVWNETQSLMREHPNLRFSSASLSMIRSVLSAAHFTQDDKMLRTVEQAINEVLEDPDAPEEFRKQMWVRTTPLLLDLFDTEEELEERLKTARSLQSSMAPTSEFTMMWIALLESIGRVEEAVSVCDNSLGKFQEQGLLRNYHTTYVIRLGCYGALGLDAEQVDEHLKKFHDNASASFRKPLQELIASYLSTVALLRDDPEWLARLRSAYQCTEERLTPVKRLMIAVEEEDINQVMRLAEEAEMPTALKEAVWLLDPAVPADDRVDREVEEQLATPVLRVVDLLVLRTLIDLLMLADTRRAKMLMPRYEPAVQAALKRAVDWLINQSLPAYLLPLLDRYAAFLPPKKVSTWRKQAQSIARRQGVILQQQVEGNEPLNVTMLGAITIQKPGESPSPVRGVRLRTLLGLLVAAEMLNKPLSHREFCHIASGRKEDPEEARKLMNGAVWRLRDLMGHAAVITDEEVPRLNLEVVDCDLVKAYRLLSTAETALQQGALMRAFPALYTVLDMTRENVAFPTLYDSFFEALREDYENRLRSTVINVIKRTLEAEDTINSEALLRRACDVMPGDEELTELLCETLERSDQRVEAERVRMQLTA